MSTSSLPNIETAAAWKQEVNDRIAAHRTRRSRKGEEHPTLPGMEDAGDPSKSSIAAKVAARYAKAPTYSEMLAAEAQNAAKAAAAAANAAHEAQAAAQAILIGLDLREEPQQTTRPAEPASATPRWVSETRTETRSETRREPWRDALPPAAPVPAEAHRNPELRITIAEESLDYPEVEYAAQPLPANLIEFPRELFATRRARPRLAEGPLRDEATLASDEPQLRIFEVEPESISTVAVVEHTHTEWSSIRLGAHPAQHAINKADIPHDPPAGSQSALTSRTSALELPLQTASLEDRSMAAIVDLALVTGAFLLYVFAFAACTPHLPTGKIALMVAAASFLAIALGYQLLFFAFAESTPGMRYAKIALCTFDDNNPTRSAMKLRIAAMLLSLSPLGLGCAWLFFDEDRLSWHDRITRTYQRSYR